MMEKATEQMSKENHQPIKILIVDDETHARMRMKDLIADIQTDCACEIVGDAADGQTALDLVVEKKPDLVLLDIQMPSMTGIELAQHIASANINPMPSIVFITAYDEYALKAFEVHAIDYLLKPVRANRLLEAVQRIVQWKKMAVQSSSLEQQNTSIKSLPKMRQNFSVLERNRVLLVPVQAVLFLKAEQKYVTIQTKDRCYLTEESLVSIESEMADYFVRAHRNALVAKSAIVGVEKAITPVDAEHEIEKNSESWQVIVRDFPERLPISRRQWAIIKALVRGA